MLRGTSSVSDDVDEDDEREAGLDLVSEDVQDSILTILVVVCRESVLPLGASKATTSEQPLPLEHLQQSSKHHQLQSFVAGSL